MPREFLDILPISQKIWQIMARIPTILYRINVFDNAFEVKNRISRLVSLDATSRKNIDSLSLSEFLPVLTHESSQELFHYEILEFFGDTVLHLYATFEVFSNLQNLFAKLSSLKFDDRKISFTSLAKINPESHFRNVSSKRSSLESNAFLAEKAREILKIDFENIIMIDFLAFKSSAHQIKNENEKILGDFMEALLAVVCRPDRLFDDELSSTCKGGITFDECFYNAADLIQNLKIIKNDKSHFINSFDTFTKIIKKSWPWGSENEISNPIQFARPIRKFLQSKLNYTFQKSQKTFKLLTMCFMPNKFQKSKQFFNYELLEWFGDAILSYLIVAFVFRKIEYSYEITPNFEDLVRKFPENRPTPGQLSKIKQILSDNKRLSNMAVEFLEFNEMCYLKEIRRCLTMDRVNVDLEVDPEDEDPELLINQKLDYKVYADMFEALVAAIFFDSGYNLEITWRAIRPCIEFIVYDELNNLDEDVRDIEKYLDMLID